MERLPTELILSICRCFRTQDLRVARLLSRRFTLVATEALFDRDSHRIRITNSYAVTLAVKILNGAFLPRFFFTRMDLEVGVFSIEDMQVLAAEFGKYILEYKLLSRKDDSPVAETWPSRYGVKVTTLLMCGSAPKLKILWIMTCYLPPENLQLPKLQHLRLFACGYEERGMKTASFFCRSSSQLKDIHFISTKPTLPSTGYWESLASKSFAANPRLTNIKITIGLGRDRNGLLLEIVQRSEGMQLTTLAYDPCPTWPVRLYSNQPSFYRILVTLIHDSSTLNVLSLSVPGMTPQWADTWARYVIPRMENLQTLGIKYHTGSTVFNSFKKVSNQHFPSLKVLKIPFFSISPIKFEGEFRTVEKLIDDREGNSREPPFVPWLKAHAQNFPNVSEICVVILAGEFSKESPLHAVCETFPWIAELSIDCQGVDLLAELGTFRHHVPIPAWSSMTNLRSLVVGGCTLETFFVIVPSCLNTSFWLLKHLTLEIDESPEVIPEIQNVLKWYHHKVKVILKPTTNRGSSYSYIRQTFEIIPQKR